MDKIHRHIPDIDVILELKSLDCITKGFKQKGFEVKVRKIAGMDLYSCNNEGFTEISLMGIGMFTNINFTVPIKGPLNVRIPSKFVKSAEYNLLGTKFIGIPLEGPVPGLVRTSYKPARKLDIAELAAVTNLNNFQT